jgi:hypothetical protein
VVPGIFLLVAGWLLINTLYGALPQMLNGVSIMGGAVTSLSISSFFEGMWLVITSGPVAGIILILLGLPVYYYLNKRSGSSSTRGTV